MREKGRKEKGKKENTRNLKKGKRECLEFEERKERGFVEFKVRWLELNKELHN